MLCKLAKVSSLLLLGAWCNRLRGKFSVQCKTRIHYIHNTAPEKIYKTLLGLSNILGAELKCLGIYQETKAKSLKVAKLQKMKILVFLLFQNIQSRECEVWNISAVNFESLVVFDKTVPEYGRVYFYFYFGQMIYFAL